MTLFKANGQFKPTAEMYGNLCEGDFITNMVSQEDVGRIKSSLEGHKKVDLFKYTIVRSFFSLAFEKYIADYAELLTYFPDNWFFYHFYQINDNKWMRRAKSVSLDSIGTNCKMNLELGLFDEFFLENKRYPFKWRLLSPEFRKRKFGLKELLPGNCFGAKQPGQFNIRILAKEFLNFPYLLKDASRITDKVRSCFRRVLIHIHGGGFITMSSGAQQNYLRKFANQSNCIVFSIDYPLAPEKRYKTIIECVFKAYLFIKAS